MTWNKVNSWFDSTFVEHFPAVVGFVVLGALVVLAFVLSDKDKRVAGFKSLQVIALIAVGFVVAAVSIGLAEPQWGVITIWAVLAAAGTEALKWLAKRNNRRLAYSLGTLAAVAVAVYLFVNLVNGSASGVVAPLAGLVVGPFLSYGLIGTDCAVDLFRVQGATIHDLRSERKKAA